jgi:glutathionyl-hydroquinone reductase
MKKIADSVNSNMYPQGFAELLKNEDKNIKAFKLDIQREKDRLDEDLTSFKVEINHTLEDLRLSLHAHLDNVYKSYL